MRISYLCLIGVAANSMSLPGYSMNAEQNSITPGQKTVYNLAAIEEANLLMNPDACDDLRDILQRGRQDVKYADSFIGLLDKTRGVMYIDTQAFDPIPRQFHLEEVDNLFHDPQQRETVVNLLISSAHALLKHETCAAKAYGSLALRLASVLRDSPILIEDDPIEICIKFLLIRTGYIVKEDCGSYWNSYEIYAYSFASGVDFLCSANQQQINQQQLQQNAEGQQQQPQQQPQQNVGGQQQQMMAQLQQNMPGGADQPQQDVVPQLQQTQPAAGATSTPQTQKEQTTAPAAGPTLSGTPGVVTMTNMATGTQQQPQTAPTVATLTQPAAGTIGTPQTQKEQTTAPQKKFRGFASGALGKGVSEVKEKRAEQSTQQTARTQPQQQPMYGQQMMQPQQQMMQPQPQMMYGQPMYGQPMYGQPMNWQPQPMYGQPMNWQPQPMYGQPQPQTAPTVATKPQPAAGTTNSTQTQKEQTTAPQKKFRGFAPGALGKK